MSAPFGPRVNGLRVIRIVLVFVCLATIGNTALNVVSLVLNGDRVDQINRERARNTSAACSRESGQNAQILAFLRSRGATQAMLEDAAQYFPVRSRKECAAMAARQVTK